MNRKRRKFWWGVGLGSAAILLVDALLLEKYFFATKTYLIGHTQGTKSLRILLLADLHFKKVFWPYYRRLAEKVNALQPDILLFAGDTLDGHSRLALVDHFLGMLTPALPKVAVPGNHDHKDAIPLEALAAVFRKHGGDLLINQTKAYQLRGERMVITGLDDIVESEACFTKAVEGVGREKNHLLLIHSPLLQEQVRRELKALNSPRAPEERLTIGYIFAGHNHGGQVRLFDFAPKLPKKAGNYLKGWYNGDRPYLYLSQGFGTSTVPFRFGARSEITLFKYLL